MRRGKSTMTLSERLLQFAQNTRRTARSLASAERQILPKRARQAEAAANFKMPFVPLERLRNVDFTEDDQKSKLAGRATLLDGCRVLILEDEYFLGHDLEQELKSRGATIVGPIADLSGAKDQIARDGFDVAIIDINLHGELAYPIADDLMRQRIPFAFATGYGADSIPARFRDVIRWEKPFEISKAVTDMARLCGQCR